MIQGDWTLRKSIVSEKCGQPGIVLDYYGIVTPNRTKIRPKVRKDL